MTRRLTALAGSLFVVAAALAGCSKGPAYGSDNAVIVVLDQELPGSVEDALRASFERDVFTTRPEGIFEVTTTTPADLGEFERWKRLVIVEALDGAVLVPELVDVDDRREIVTEVEDEWARGQAIWIVAADTPERTAELAASVADSLFEVVHARFVEHHVDRMWASKADSVLADSLAAELGFSIVLPRVYREAPGSAPAETRMFFNREPRRIVSLHWRPAPDSLTPAAVIEARRAWGREAFPDELLALPDTLDGEIPASADTAGPGAPGDTTAPGGLPPAAARGGPTHLETRQVELDGHGAIRLRGLWREADGTSAGLFVTHGVVCGERLVLIDATLFAPDREKYPYVIQFDRIAGTFRCEGGA